MRYITPEDAIYCARFLVTACFWLTERAWLWQTQQVFLTHFCCKIFIEKLLHRWSIIGSVLKLRDSWVSCDIIPGEMGTNVCSFPIGDLTTNQRRENTFVQFGEPNSLGGAYRNMSEGLLTGAAMTQRQHNHQNPPQHGWWLREAGTLEHTARKLNLGENCYTKG